LHPRRWNYDNQFPTIALSVVSRIPIEVTIILTYFSTDWLIYHSQLSNICNLLLLHSYFFFVHDVLMENESSVNRLRRKLSELSEEYSKEKQTQPRSKSANGRLPPSDPNASFRYRRMRRKVFEKKDFSNLQKIFIDRLTFSVHKSMLLYKIIIFQ
jgi:hypothetical protein